MWSVALAPGSGSAYSVPGPSSRPRRRTTPRLPAWANRAASRSAASDDSRCGGTSRSGVSSSTSPVGRIDERDRRLHVDLRPGHECRIDEQPSSVCPEPVVLPPGVGVASSLARRNPRGEVVDGLDLQERFPDPPRVEQIELAMIGDADVVARCLQERQKGTAENAARTCDKDPQLGRSSRWCVALVSARVVSTSVPQQAARRLHHPSQSNRLRKKRGRRDKDSVKETSVAEARPYEAAENLPRLVVHDEAVHADHDLAVAGLARQRDRRMTHREAEVTPGRSAR